MLCQLLRKRFCFLINYYVQNTVGDILDIISRKGGATHDATGYIFDTGLRLPSCSYGAADERH
jgi:hypothetical protein